MKIVSWCILLFISNGFRNLCFIKWQYVNILTRDIWTVLFGTVRADRLAWSSDSERFFVSLILSLNLQVSIFSLIISLRATLLFLLILRSFWRLFKVCNQNLNWWQLIFVTNICCHQDQNVNLHFWLFVPLSVLFLAEIRAQWTGYQGPTIGRNYIDWLVIPKCGTQTESGRGKPSKDPFLICCNVSLPCFTQWHFEFHFGCSIK